MTKEKEMENSTGQMEEFIKVNGKKENKMASGIQLTQLQEKNFMDILKKGKNPENSLNLTDLIQKITGNSIKSNLKKIQTTLKITNLMITIRIINKI